MNIQKKKGTFIDPYHIETNDMVGILVKGG